MLKYQQTHSWGQVRFQPALSRRPLLSNVVGGYAAGIGWLSACFTAAESIRGGDLGERRPEHWQGWH